MGGQQRTDEQKRLVHQVIAQRNLDANAIGMNVVDPTLQNIALQNTVQAQIRSHNPTDVSSTSNWHLPLLAGLFVGGVCLYARYVGRVSASKKRSIESV